MKHLKMTSETEDSDLVYRLMKEYRYQTQSCRVCRLPTTCKYKQENWRTNGMQRIILLEAKDFRMTTQQHYPFEAISQRLWSSFSRIYLMCWHFFNNNSLILSYIRTWAVEENNKTFIILQVPLLCQIK